MYSEISNNNLQNKDNFKQKFKYYKSNRPKPSLENIIVPSECITDRVTPEDIRTELLGLRKYSSWRTFSFRDHPGLLLIRNPFTVYGQRYWIRKCLQIYPRKPNKRNIDIEMDIQDWWKECFKEGDCNRQLQKKLRWTTLGYHHNWDTKIYSEDNKTPFPADLAELSDVVAKYLGFKDFKAEAAIVNYYHMDSTLAPHTDHSEVNLEAPLLSFSFGQPAIFLIGGKDKSIEPSAILLHSGDIVIMSKEARLCYHAVPKIIPASSFPWRAKGLEDCDDDGQFFNLQDVVHHLKYLKNPIDMLNCMQKNLDSSEWSPFSAYVEASRINMNVRQVLNEKQNIL